MEDHLMDVSISHPALLNSTFDAVSCYLEDPINVSLEQQQFFQHKISLLENEIKTMTRNQILVESQPIKLVDIKDLELSFDKNIREYYLTLYKVKHGQLSPPRFNIDNLEHGLLYSSKVDTLSSIMGNDITHAFDMFSAMDGLSPKISDQNKLLRPPPFIFNTRPVSPLSQTTSIQQQLQDSSLFYNFDKEENEIAQLQARLLQQSSQPSLQLLKITQSEEISIPMQVQQDPQQEKTRWKGILQIKKQLKDVCLQTQPSSVITQQNPNQTKCGQTIIERIVQKIIEVPVQTLLIVEQVVPIMTQNALEVDFEQFDIDKQNKQHIVFEDELQINHTDERTREMYNKVISQNDFLRQQVITLIDQLQQYKVEIQKNKHIIAEFQVKVNSTANRDFYKLKLSDLERKITEKTVLLEQINKNIHTSQLRNIQNSEGTSQLIKHYQSTFTQMSEQIQTLKTKIYELREKESSRIEDESSKISRYIEQIESREKQIQELSKANQQYRLQLQEQIEANSDLKNIVQKLWQQTQELSSKLSHSQKQLQHMNENQSRLSQDKDDIQQMNSLVSTLTQQISVIKQQLYIKQQKQHQNLQLNQEYEHKIYQYQQQIQMQALTIQQFKNTCEKSEQYIMLLNQQIHHLKRVQQKSDYKIKSHLGSVTNLKDMNTESKFTLNKQHNLYSSNVAEFKQLLSLNNNSNKQYQYSQFYKYKQPHSLSGQNSSFQSNITQRQIFLQQLSTSQFSSQTIHQLIIIIKQSNTDIQTLEAQNKYLMNLIVQFEKLIQHQKSNNSLNPQLSEQDIVSILIENQRLEKELSEAQGSNIDINFFEQIVNELQKSKQLNNNLHQQIDKIKRELLSSQAQIFQKTQAINYLNLALIKTSGNKIDIRNNYDQNTLMKQIEIQNSQLKQQLEALLDINKTLQASIQKLSQIKNQQIQALSSEITTLESFVIPNLNREIRQLEMALQTADRDRILKLNQIRQLQRGKKQQHSKSAINILQKHYFISGDSIEMRSKKQIAKSNKKINPIQCSIDQIKGQNLQTTTILYIMYRLAEFILQTIQKKTFKLLSPKSVILLNYSEAKPELIQIMTLSVNPQQTQLFVSPEVLRGNQFNEQSCCWNFGLLIDFLINGRMFFSSKQQILNEDEYVFKHNFRQLSGIKQIIESLILKNPQQRQTISNTVQVLKQLVYETM